MHFVTLICIISVFFTTKAFALRRFDLSLNGNYQTSYASTYKYTRTFGEIELSIPMNSYMEFTTGEDITIEKYNFTEDYKQFLIDKGLDLPPGDILRETKTFDTYANMGVGMYAWNVAPSIFGGIIHRHQCSQDYISGSSCDDVPITWNAGATVSIYMNPHFRFKFTYKISPSVSYYGNSKYDETYSAGITYVN